jgi:membrane-associated phospholipid phosphatase
MAGNRLLTSATDQASKPVTLLIPDRARRPAVIVAICCAAVLAIGGAFAAGRSGGNAIDRRIDPWVIQHLQAHQNGLYQLTNLGNPTPVATLTVIVILCCLVVRRVNGALLAAVSVPVASGLTELVLKHIVHETFGHPPILSYPSGHTTSVCSLAAVVAVLMINPPHRRLHPVLRLAVAVLAGLVTVTVMVALVAVQFHYFTDTIGGACVAIGTVLSVALLLDAPAARARMARWSFRSGP